VADVAAADVAAADVAAAHAAAAAGVVSASPIAWTCYVAFAGDPRGDLEEYAAELPQSLSGDSYCR